jgi:ribosomal protein L11 methyltransferase
MESTRDTRIDETIAFSIVVAAGKEEAASAILWDLDTNGVESRETPTGRVQLVAYFDANASIELKRIIADRLRGLLLEPVTTLSIPQIDWRAHWRRFFKPTTIGSLTIAPPWNTPAISRERLIVIDPGRSFGTGAHETTQLCLELIESLARRTRLGSILDVGTGTGVLAIAAARLGATFVVACDIDEDALQSARAHSARNGVSISILRTDGAMAFRPASFDVVVANLSTPFLTERMSELRSTAKRFLILSGFLGEDAGSLDAARADRRSTFHLRGDWAALLQDLS